MTKQSDPDLSPIPEGFRWITWEIGTKDLQKSVMSVETFEALLAGETNVEKIRNAIRQRRKLLVSVSTGAWTKTPSDRFVNEHAWILSIMNQFGMIPAVNQRTKETSLFPGAIERLATLVEYFRRNEPFMWEPGRYKKAPGW